MTNEARVVFGREYITQLKEKFWAEKNKQVESGEITPFNRIEELCVEMVFAFLEEQLCTVGPL